MPSLTIIKTATKEPVLDENGLEVQLLHSNDESACLWIEQLCFKMNNYGKTNEFQIETSESDQEFLERQNEFLFFVKENGNFPAELKAEDLKRLIALAEYQLN
jgi:hypothetical protein